MIENLGCDSRSAEFARVIYLESDTRFRKALKLVAFYAEVSARVLPGSAGRFD